MYTKKSEYLTNIGSALKTLKHNTVEDEIPERVLQNPQMSCVGSWNRRRPSQLPLLLYTLYLICNYI